MKLVPLLTLAMALVATSAWAATDDKHAVHHPAAGASAPAAKAMSGKANPGMARMGAQMKVMRDMHEKMMAATTPEERNALMAEHMKAMQDGMAMMNGMAAPGMTSGRGDMGTSHQSMEERMEMMQTMMQMMMDRLPAGAVK